MEVDRTYKLVIVGNSGVGKSCILLQFSDGIFREEELATIGVDFKIKTVELDGMILKLQIWDTAGQERFSTITSSYYRGAHGIIVVYDVTNKESFEKVSTWMQQVSENAPKGVVSVLVGNKTDLTNKRVVTKQQGQELANSYKIEYIETSAKDDSNIQNLFLTMTKNISHEWNKNPQQNQNIALKPVELNKKSKKKKCC